ncbi:DNA-binding protein [Planomonospora sphaerica]|uniref:DNA-binding protein n=1 Tax=Planomonospora sphaerica TaxID=161355 RepID=A0A171D3P5_9ACTN|nr:YbaB/EbfC family nucleoid-associated protein [Planomonospora sphaerica]GAT67602.1 DNA-binding protein [Planomonospora sphaerica]
MDEFRAAMDGLAAEYDRQAERLREVYGRLGELSATACSRDRMVTVTVGPRGRVQKIEFDPRVYRRLSPSELAQTIMEQIDAATAEVAEGTRELMAPFVPEGLPYEEVFGEGVDLASFLPRSADLRVEERG